MASGIPIDGDKLAAMWRDSLLPQELFAAKMGLGRSGLGRLVQPGIHGVHARRLVKLADSLGIDIRELQKRLSPDKTPSGGKRATPIRFNPPPELVARLRELAGVWGVTPEQAIERLLDSVIVVDEPELTAESTSRAASSRGKAGSGKRIAPSRTPKGANAGKSEPPR